MHDPTQVRKVWAVYKTRTGRCYAAAYHGLSNLVVMCVSRATAICEARERNAARIAAAAETPEGKERG